MTPLETTSREVDGLGIARRELDATEARNLEGVTLGGYALLVETAPLDADARVHIDTQQGRQELRLFPGLTIRAPAGFKRFWLSNDASSVTGSKITFVVVQEKGVMLDLGRRDITIGGRAPTMEDDGRLFPVADDDDAGATLNDLLQVGARSHVWTPSAWERLRGKYRETILPNAARTTTTTKEFTLYGTGALIFVNVVSVTGAPSLTPDLFAKNSEGSFSRQWAAAASITGAGNFVYLFYPGASGGSMTEVKGIALAPDLRFRLSHGTADSVTYSVDVVHLP